MRALAACVRALHALPPALTRGLTSATLPPPPSTVPNQGVVVTGLGLISPLGVGVPGSWAKLLQGQTGTLRLEPHHLPPTHAPLLPQLPCKVAALVPQEEREAALNTLDKEDRSKRCSLFMQYALLAAHEAILDAGWDPNALSSEQLTKTGVAIGSGMSSCQDIIDAWQLLADDKLRRISPFFVPKILPNMAAGAIGIKYGFNGPTHSASTACATGNHSIGDAFRMIQRGEAECMVSGASEACIDALSLAGFSRLKALTVSHNDSPARASRPFDVGRAGFVMGEGAGCVVLESKEHAARRGARVYAEVRGYGMSGDGHHITQPHPEGLGARLAMQRALSGSGLQPEHVAYINAHATSTPLGDDAEQVAILAALGDKVGHRAAVSSTKGATGHLLGAAGAVETGLVGKTTQPLPEGPKAALCNAFGFGGTNASLLVATPSS